MAGCARKLGVNIDLLLNADLTMMSSSQIKISSLIKKLCEETVSLLLRWNCETSSFLNNIDPQSDGIYHDLFEFVYSNNYSYSEYMFNSKKFEDKTEFVGNSYNVPLTKKSKLYLMHVGSKEYDNISSLEIWIKGTDSKPELVCSDEDEMLQDDICKLYQILEKISLIPPLSKSHIASIDSYLNDEDESEEETGMFDLPF